MSKVGRSKKDEIYVFHLGKRWASAHLTEWLVPFDMDVLNKTDLRLRFYRWCRLDFTTAENAARVTIN